MKRSDDSAYDAHVILQKFDSGDLAKAAAGAMKHIADLELENKILIHTAERTQLVLSVWYERWRDYRRRWKKRGQRVKRLEKALRFYARRRDL